MDFTDPFQGMGLERPLSESDTVAALRIDAATELDAINLYQAHIDVIPDPEIRRVIEGVRDDEKQHLAEFIAAIKRLDPIQARELGKALPASVSQETAFPVVDQAMQTLDERVAAIEESLRSPTGQHAHMY